jgi:hypothetical protein
MTRKKRTKKKDQDGSAIAGTNFAQADVGKVLAGALRQDAEMLRLTHNSLKMIEAANSTRALDGTELQHDRHAVGASICLTLA